MASFVVLSLLSLLAGLASPLWAHTSCDGIARAEWHWRPDVLLVVVSFGTIYTHGWLRLRRRSAHTAQTWQLALYLLGLAAICLALISPIDALASTLLHMHMVQHLLLLMIAPLLLLLANGAAGNAGGLS